MKVLREETTHFVSARYIKYGASGQEPEVLSHHSHLRIVDLGREFQDPVPLKSSRAETETPLLTLIILPSVR